jgi:hypothetical protein
VGDQEKTRIIVAPHAGSSDKSAQVISLVLSEDEDVLWQWTHYPDGTSAVTGYEIIKKSERSND